MSSGKTEAAEAESRFVFRDPQALLDPQFEAWRSRSRAGDLTPVASVRRFLLHGVRAPSPLDKDKLPAESEIVEVRLTRRPARTRRSSTPIGGGIVIRDRVSTTASQRARKRCRADSVSVDT